jgi:hypothetical protein
MPKICTILESAKEWARKVGVGVCCLLLPSPPSRTQLPASLNKVKKTEAKTRERERERER